MKNKLKIYFSDFWDSFLYTDNYFYNLLSSKYELEITQTNPDLVIYSVFGKNHKVYDKTKVVKIFFTGENIRPNFDECNFALSFDYLEDNRSFRLPLWVLHFNWFSKDYNPNRDHAYLHDVNTFLEQKTLTRKDKFCSFIVSNPNSFKRINFALNLSRYKKIDSPGKVLNNMSVITGRGDHIEKINFLKNYKFNICFENSSYPGYCTEKIIHSMFSNCIPIYYGDPFVDRDFNKKSFLNLHNFETENDFIQEIIEIDNDEKKYKRIIEEPWFIDNQFPERFLPESVLSFFEKIINDNVK